MSAQVFEDFLARLYTDTEFRELFLAAPGKAFEGYDLTRREAQDLMKIDQAGLVMTAHSLHHKQRSKTSALGRLKGRLGQRFRQLKRLVGEFI